MCKRGKNEYYENVKLTLLILRFIGVFPFEFRESVRSWSRIRSNIIFFISICMYMYTCQEFISYIYNFFTQIMQKVAFDHIMALLSALFVRTIFIAIPASVWGERQSIKNFIRNWHQFQMEFGAESAHFLPKSIATKTRRAFIIGFFLSTCLVISIYLATLGLPYGFSFLSLFVLVTANHLLPVYWYINGSIVTSVMETILARIEHCISIGDYRKLKQFEHLWIRLCDLNDEFQTCHSNLFLSQLGLIVVNAVFTAYSVLSFLMGHIDLNIPVFLFSTFQNLSLIYVYVEVAHRVQLKMTGEVQNTLVNKNIVNVNPQILQEIMAVSIDYIIIIRQFGLD